MVTRRKCPGGKVLQDWEVKEDFWRNSDSPVGPSGVARVEERRGTFWKG